MSTEYYLKNKEVINKRIRKWQIENHEKLAATQAKYYQTHKEAINAKRKVPRSNFIFYQDFLKPFLALDNLINNDLLEKLASHDLPLQQLYIMTLWQNEPSMTQEVLAEKLNISQSHLSRVINNKLYPNLKQLITTYKTKNQELLSLIIKVTLQK